MLRKSGVEDCEVLPYTIEGTKTCTAQDKSAQSLLNMHANLAEIEHYPSVRCNVMHARALYCCPAP